MKGSVGIASDSPLTHPIPMPRTYEKFQPMTNSFGAVSIAVTDGTTTVNRTVNQLLDQIATAFDTYKAVDADTIGQASTVAY